MVSDGLSVSSKLPSCLGSNGCINSNVNYYSSVSPLPFTIPALANSRDHNTSGPDRLQKIFRWTNFAWYPQNVIIAVAAFFENIYASAMQQVDEEFPIVERDAGIPYHVAVSQQLQSSPGSISSLHNNSMHPSGHMAWKLAAMYHAWRVDQLTDRPHNIHRVDRPQEAHLGLFAQKL